MSYVSPFTGDVIQPTDVSYRSFTIAVNTTLSWPINGNATGNYASRIMEVTASVGSLSLYMPPANQTSVGTDSLIRNLGSNTFTVKDNNGGSIVSIAAGEAKYIYVTTNPDVAGTWGIIAFGVGTSNVDASALAGYGLVASANTLNQSHPAASFSNTYTFLAADRAQTKLWASGSGSATLPAAASLGNNWFTILKNSGTGTLTVSCTGAETIDGVASKSFNPDDSAFIVCTGAAYVSIGYGVGNLFAFTALTKPVTGGAYTLSSVEAANTIQEYVGTLTSNVTVTYPPVVNLYVVSNQTVDGGYSLTITTGVVASATATIPPGQQATLVCDGDNFFNANTVQAGATSLSIVNGTVSTPAINFASETSTGIYRPGIGRFGISVSGALVLDVLTTGVKVTGTGTFGSGVTGGIAGGVFT